MDGDGRRGRSLLADERAGIPGVTGFDSTLLVLVVAVLMVPPLVAVVGVFLRRDQSFEYLFAAAASLMAVFTLTGTTQFALQWTVLGILAILAAIGSHLWQFRTDRTDLLVVGGIYATPIGLAAVLLLRVVVGI